MTKEKRQQFQSVKSIDEVSPQEYESYLQIPGWRIWHLDVWNWSSHKEIADIVTSKNKALYIFNEDPGAKFILTKQKRNFPLPFISGAFVTYSFPDYLLEPLSEEELKNIIQEREASDWKSDFITHDLLIAVELEKIFKDER